MCACKTRSMAGSLVVVLSLTACQPAENKATSPDEQISAQAVAADAAILVQAYECEGEIHSLLPGVDVIESESFVAWYELEAGTASVTGLWPNAAFAPELDLEPEVWRARQSDNKLYLLGEGATEQTSVSIEISINQADGEYRSDWRVQPKAFPKPLDAWQSSGLCVVADPADL